jgi:hypothetical protein
VRADAHLLQVTELARDAIEVNQTPDTRCLIGPQGENCIGGYGNRTLLRFTTLIHNPGQDDCIVGSTPVCPPPSIVPPDQGACWTGSLACGDSGG